MADNPRNRRRAERLESREKRKGDSDDDLSVEEVLEDAAELFTADDRSEPASDADAPPPG